MENDVEKETVNDVKKENVIIVTENYNGELREAIAVIETVYSKDLTVDGCGLLRLRANETAVCSFKLTELPDDFPTKQDTEVKVRLGLDPETNTDIIVEIIWD